VFLSLPPGRYELAAELSVEAGRIRPAAGDSPTRPLVLEDGEFWYEKVTWISIEEGAAIRDEAGVAPGDSHAAWETWWRSDGSGRIRVLNEARSYGEPQTGVFASGEFPIESDVSGLSTDPDHLQRQLVERSSSTGASPQPAGTPDSGTGETYRLWRAVERLLEFPNATPQLRAALFVVARRLVGVEVLPDEIDPGGRDAIGLRLGIDRTRTTLFFDPSTFQVMSSERRSPFGSTYYWIREAGIVDSTDEQPEGGQRAYPPPMTGMPRR
jgi:hypothetical protein